MVSTQRIINNKRLFRFEFPFDDGEIGYLEYRWLKGKMVLMHTIVPGMKSGNGIGAELVRHTLEHAYAGGLEVVLYCPFAQGYVEKHPEYKALIHK
ncbi:MAG: N-acetyltransferase [Taibaiella sp.]|nr:N-acetyltransferase [Taibaiella sp.]